MPSLKKLEARGLTTICEVTHIERVTSRYGISFRVSLYLHNVEPCFSGTWFETEENLLRDGEDHLFPDGLRQIAVKRHFGWCLSKEGLEELMKFLRDRLPEELRGKVIDNSAAIEAAEKDNEEWSATIARSWVSTEAVESAIVE